MAAFQPRVRYLPFVDRDGRPWRVYQFNARHSWDAQTPYVTPGSAHGGEFRGFVPDDEARRPRRIFSMRHHHPEDREIDGATLQRQLDESEIDRRDAPAS